MKRFSFNHNGYGRVAPTIRLRDCSESEQQLLHTMREIAFGWLKDVPIHDGIIELTGARIITTYRLGGAETITSGRLEPATVLKRCHVDLFGITRSIVSGVIAQLTIQDCLPLQVSVEEFQASAA